MTDPRVEAKLICAQCDTEENIGPALWAHQRSLEPIMTIFTTVGATEEARARWRETLELNMIRSMALAHFVRFHGIDPHDELALQEASEDMRALSYGYGREGFDADIRKLLDEETRGNDEGRLPPE